MIFSWLRRLAGDERKQADPPIAATPPVESLSQGALPCKWGPYTLLRYLGTDQLGETFVAKRTGTGGAEERRQIVRSTEKALFILRRGLVRPSSNPWLARGLNEVAIYRQIGHPAICRLVTVESLDGLPLVVSEYAPGRSLLRLVIHYRSQGKKLPWPVAAYVAHEACAILEHLHTFKDTRGNPWHIVLSHFGAFTPADFYIDYPGEIRLANLGIAFLIRRAIMVPEGGDFHSHSPFYVSPEVVAGLPVEPCSDLFSLGWMLWELVTGERLFAGATEIETLESIRAANARPPIEFRSEIPAELNGLILRLLARAPDDRPASASDVKRDLAALTDLTDARAQLREIMGAVFVDDHEQFRQDLRTWAGC